MVGGLGLECVKRGYALAYRLFRIKLFEFLRNLTMHMFSILEHLRDLVDHLPMVCLFFCILRTAV